MKNSYLTKNYFAREFNLLNRLLSVEFGAFNASLSPPPNSFLPFRLELDERLSSPFRAVIRGITPQVWTYPGAEGEDDRQVAPSPDRFLGQLTAIVIRAESRLRRVNGVVTGARHLGQWYSDTEGTGYDAFELVVEPSLRLMDLRRANRLYQERTTLEILHELLDEHQMLNPVVNASLRPTFPRQRHTDRNLARACRTQFQETDLAFVHRLLTDEGLNYVLRTDEGAIGFGHAWHVFAPDHDFGTDYDATLSATPRPGELALLHWTSRRQLVPGYTRAVSHDYKDNNRHEGRGEGRRNEGMAAFARGDVGHYETLPPRAVAPSAGDMTAPANHRQWAHDMEAEVFSGRVLAPLEPGRPIRVLGLAAGRRPGSCSRQSPGREDDYLVTAQALSAQVALPGDVAECWAGMNRSVLEATGAPLFASTEGAPALECTFEAQALGTPIVPAHPARAERPCPGPMTATVVGPEGAVVATDALGRIAVAFHWERPSDAPEFACNFPDFSREPQIRVRYVHPGAGAAVGMQYLPRVGDEVLIVFIDNDPDRPIAMGSVHNGHQAPPRFGGVSALPHDLALTGLRTGEHQGRGANELVMDDTTRQVGVRLATTTAASDLNLGHIATPRKHGKATKRGVGAELRTEGAAVIRATQGILVSTEAAARDAHLMHHAELAELLARCEELTQALAQAVSRAGGADTCADGQAGLKASLGSWAGAGAVAGGQGAHAASVLALHGKQGIVAATPASCVTYAGEHIDMAADGDASLVSGGRTHVTAGQGLTMHACAGGVDLRATRGPVRIEAAEHDMRIEARQRVTMSSVDEDVVITGRSIRLIAGDGSFIRIGDGIEVGSPGACHVRVDRLNYTDSREIPRDIVHGKPERTRQRVQFVYHDFDPAYMLPVQGLAYKGYDPDGKLFEGKTDADGMTAWIESDGVGRARVWPADADREQPNAGDVACPTDTGAP